jgi:flagellar biosynthesis protein FliQ
LLLQFVTGNLQRVIMEFISLLNHHVMPYYDSKHAASHLFWMYYTVLVGSLLASLIIGSFVAIVAKRREVIATMTLSFVSLIMAVTIFRESVAMHYPVDPGLFPKIFIGQLGASFLIVIGGIIVREIRSAAAQSLSDA